MMPETFEPYEKPAFVDLTDHEGNVRRIDLLGNKKLTLASRFGALAGFAAITVVGPMGAFFLNDWISFRKEASDTLQELRSYMAGAQERGRNLLSITQRHETEIQQIKSTMNEHSNRITAVEVELRQAREARGK